MNFRRSTSVVLCPHTFNQTKKKWGTDHQLIGNSQNLKRSILTNFDTQAPDSQNRQRQQFHTSNSKKINFNSFSLFDSNISQIPKEVESKQLLSDILNDPQLPSSLNSKEPLSKPDSAQQTPYRSLYLQNDPFALQQQQSEALKRFRVQFLEEYVDSDQENKCFGQSQDQADLSFCSSSDDYYQDSQTKQEEEKIKEKKPEITETDPRIVRFFR